MEAKFIDRHRAMIVDAAGLVVAVADDSSTSLVDVLAELERYIIQETKVGDAAGQDVPPERRGYTLVNGRLVEVAKTSPEPAQPAQPDQPAKKKHKKRSRPHPISSRTKRDAGRVGSSRRR